MFAVLTSTAHTAELSVRGQNDNNRYLFLSRSGKTGSTEVSQRIHPQRQSNEVMCIENEVAHYDIDVQFTNSRTSASSGWETN
mmetsp:Transcript_26824/g.32504  ORF Transcript_26824/g.32504 Transcript_26824/m.32504 type:complete len:83 (+) Transcript_26824:68-316(+)